MLISMTFHGSGDATKVVWNGALCPRLRAPLAREALVLIPVISRTPPMEHKHELWLSAYGLQTISTGCPSLRGLENREEESLLNMA